MRCLQTTHCVEVKKQNTHRLAGWKGGAVDDCDVEDGGSRWSLFAQERAPGANHIKPAPFRNLSQCVKGMRPSTAVWQRRSWKTSSFGARLLLGCDRINCCGL